MIAYVLHRTSALITDADLAAIVEACAGQLRDDYAPDYGVTPPSVWIWTSGPLNPGEVRVELCDLPADVEPGALAWHTVTDDQPMVKIPVNRILAQPGATVLDGQASLCVVVSHELLEGADDPLCNRWTDADDGTEVAEEIADPVQAYSYERALANERKASVSAYVKPAWFDPQAPDGSDFARGVPAGKIRRHHQVADGSDGTPLAGGYAITRTVGGERQVGGVRAIVGASPRAEAARRALALGHGRIGRRIRVAAGVW